MSEMKNLNDRGFLLFDFPRPPADFLASFDHLCRDRYSGGQRYRRYSQYRLRFADGRWRFNLLPQRPLIQSKVHNPYSGDQVRHFEPVEVDPSPYLGVGLEAGGLDTGCEWHLDLSQFRVKARPGVEGIPVPEGPHQDGHCYVMLLIFARQEVKGGETTLRPLDGGEPFFRAILEPGQGILLDDRRMLHNASPVEVIGEAGHRDIFGTSINTWEQRRYGPEFERSILEQAQGIEAEE
ncbi:MAG: 2OG-Fe dioxygenase family protein [Thermoanaerobaculia bacterium]